jgi:hypothetical protein
MLNDVKRVHIELLAIGPLAAAAAVLGLFAHDKVAAAPPAGAANGPTPYNQVSVISSVAPQPGVLWLDVAVDNVGQVTTTNGHIVVAGSDSNGNLRIYKAGNPTAGCDDPPAPTLAPGETTTGCAAVRLPPGVTLAHVLEEYG